MSKSAQELVKVLDPVADDAIRIAAILWTWLDQYRLTLGELRRKPPEIRAEALMLGPLARIGRAERDRLLEAPIPVAAELLARIGEYLSRHPPHGMFPTASVDGSEVLVMWKHSPLIDKLDDKQIPPSAVEQPSLAALAPRLVVVPRVCNQVTLEPLAAAGDAWRAACHSLEQGCANDKLSIHLDCLGDAGLEPCEKGVPGWRTDPVRAVGWFDEEALARNVEDECEAAARQAVRDAADPNAVLVLPELVASTRVEGAIVSTLQQLDEEDRSPALTVVGLYHRPSSTPHPRSPQECALLGEEELSIRVNEALVLGPDGSELWRHRKLSAAQAPLGLTGSAVPEMDGDVRLPITEDIAFGRSLTLAKTPIGWLAVVICIDVFAGHLAPRLERCGADVLLVPSLSPTVHRHRNAAQLLVQRLWAVGLVCNRAHLPPYQDDGDQDKSRWNESQNRSFWAIARKAPQEPVPPPGEQKIVFALPGGVQRI